MPPVGELVHLNAVVVRVRHVHKATVHSERLRLKQLSVFVAELAEREAEVACFRREHSDSGAFNIAGRKNEQRIACEGEVVRKGAAVSQVVAV